MKKQLKLVALLGLALGLSGCAGADQSSSGASTSAVPEITYKVTSMTLEAKQDYTYKVGFKLDKEVEEGTEFYLSDNSRFEKDDDKKLSIENTGNQYSFIYSEPETEFYLLVVGDNTAYCKQNVILPTVNPLIVTKDNKDAISFVKMQDDKTIDQYFVSNSLTVYQSSTAALDKTTAVKVVENGDLSKTYDVSSVSGADYYTLEYKTSSKITYTSKTFKKDVPFGSDVFTFQGVSLNSEGDLVIQGLVNEGVKKGNLCIVSSSDTHVVRTALTIKDDNTFTVSFNLSYLATADVDYHLYLELGAGSFVEVPDIIEKDQSVTLAEKVVFLKESGEGLVVSYKEKQAITVLNASMVKDTDGIVYFEASGLYDETKANVALSSPSLIIDNDQNEVVDKQVYPLTVDETAKSFSVKAKLSQLVKQGAWYNVKIWLNTTLEGSTPTYEFSHDDCTNPDVSLKDDVNDKKFYFQNYENFLKIYYDDVSASITSWNYVKKEGVVYLHLEGNDASSTVTDNYVTVYQDGAQDDGLHRANCVKGEDDAFTIDIPISDISAGVKYQVHWVRGNNNSEITNNTLPKPNSVLASDDGFIYCVKEGEWNGTHWWKVYKDNDIAKANDLSFELSENKPVFTLKGALNSEYKTKDLYIRYGVLNEDSTFTDSFYSSLVLDANLNFTSAADLQSMVKTKEYEARLVEKSGDEYLELPSGANSFCGFYNEYLRSDFSSSSLTTDSGTYSVDTYKEGNYTLYLTLK